MGTPVFVRRKQSTKRRSRSTFGSAETDVPTIAHPPAASTSTPFPNPRITPKRTSRTRLRAPPPVLGYDHASATPSTPAKSRYSTEQLNALRQGTNHELSSAVDEPVEQPVPDEAPPSVTPVVETQQPLSPPPPPPPPISARPHKSRPDPFSKDWRNALDSDQPSLVEQDDCVPFRQTSTSANPELAPSASDSSEAEHEREWQKHLLQRAGVNVKAATRTVQKQINHQEQFAIRDMLLSVDEDIDVDIIQGQAALKKLLADISRKHKESQLIAETATEKERNIQMEVEKSNIAQQDANVQSRDDADALAFYDQFANDMDVLCASLRTRRKAMLQVREQRIKNLQERSSVVLHFLKSDTDEFGRVRRAGMGVSIPGEDRKMQETLDENDHPLSDIPKELRSIELLASRFSEWQRRYESEYSDVFGDVGFGRLAGALGTCEPDLTWLCHLNDLQKTAACKVCDIVEEATLTVRAIWQPKDPNSCEAVGNIVQLLWKVGDETDMVRIVSAVSERLEVEIFAAKAVGDGTWVWLVVCGGLSLCRAIECGWRVVEMLLTVAEKVDAGLVRDLPRLRDSLSWLLTLGDAEEHISIKRAAAVLLDRVDRS